MEGVDVVGGVGGECAVGSAGGGLGVPSQRDIAGAAQRDGPERRPGGDGFFGGKRRGGGAGEGFQDHVVVQAGDGQDSAGQKRQGEISPAAAGVSTANFGVATAVMARSPLPLASKSSGGRARTIPPGPT